MLRKVNLVCVGTLKKSYFKNLCEKLSYNINLIEVKESDCVRESFDILNILKKVPKAYSVLFDLDGFDSKNVLHKIRSSYFSNKSVYFIIGGSNGVTPILKDYCDVLLKLSYLTYNHQIFRICSMIFINESLK